MATAPWFISADSHVVEPPDLWTTRIEPRFKNRAPRVISEIDGKKGDFFVCEDLKPFDVSRNAAAGVSGKDLAEQMTRGYRGVRQGAWDPAERLKDMAMDGVKAEVLYSSLALRLFALEDVELRAASFRAYNDWMADFCRHDPKAYAGVGLLPMESVDVAAKEIRRSAKIGLKGGLMGGIPPELPLDNPAWDPFWAAAQDVGMSLSIHPIPGRPAKNPDGTRFERPDNLLMKEYPSMPHVHVPKLTEILFGGVLERFPKLRIVLVELDAGWIANYIQRIDHGWDKFRFLGKIKTTSEPPSTYFHRQVWATFQEDRAAVLTREIVGVENLMWGSDYPHADSTWPKSGEVIERDFRGVPESDKRKILADNCAAFYGIG